VFHTWAFSLRSSTLPNVKMISGKDEQETKVTTSLKTTIQSLRKYTNYSISVLAFTSIGDGVRSPPVFCCTEEDGMYHQYLYVLYHCASSVAELLLHVVEFTWSWFTHLLQFKADLNNVLQHMPFGFRFMCYCRVLCCWTWKKFLI